MSGWLLAGLPLYSAGLAALELDAVLIGQWLVSRPLVVGPLMGWLAGDLGAGLVLGALVEAFCLEQLPVGSVVPPNGTVAAGCAVLLTVGPAAVPPAAALPAALALGSAHGWVENRVRSWRAGLTARAADDISTAGRVSWGRTWTLAVGVHWAATALFVYLAVGGGGALMGRVVVLLPYLVRAGLDHAWTVSPFLALGSLLQRLWR